MKEIMQKHPLIMVFGVYLGIVAVFGIVYWRLFKLYPDNFIVNERLAAYELDYEERSDSISRLFLYHYKELQNVLGKRDKMIAEVDELEKKWKEIKITLHNLGNVETIENMEARKIDSLMQLRNRILDEEKETFERIYELELDSIPSLNVLSSKERILASVFIRNKVNFFHFFYYSLGIATTTTFGDLIANTTVVKLFTALELLSCVFLVGYMINILNKKSGKNDSKN